MAESLMREVFQDARSVPAFAEPTRRIKTNAFTRKLGVKRKRNKSLFEAGLAGIVARHRHRQADWLAV
jgi:hypothetical protein